MPANKHAVYREVHKSGKRVAHKVFSKRNPRAFDAYRREVTSLVKLRESRYVVPLVDASEDDDAFHVMTEWCDQGSVPFGRLTESRAVEISKNLSESLADIHRRGVVHGDIKQANIVLPQNDSSSLWLIDFEESMSADKIVDPYIFSLRGTPSYMAPETFRAKVSPASDVWAMGVTVFAMLTGQMPFRAKYAHELPQKITESKPDFDLLPNQLSRDFVRRCLTKDPSQRASAEELIKFHAWIA